MQLATVLYNARINDYRLMRALTARIDRAEGEPEAADIRDLAETRARQLLAFEELRSINLTGKPLGKHPLAMSFTELSQLEELKERWPERFMKEHYLCQRNVTRYERYLRDPSKAADAGKYSELLAKHKARREAFLEVMRKGEEIEPKNK